MDAAQTVARGPYREGMALSVEPHQIRRAGIAGGLSFLLHSFVILLGAFCLRASLPRPSPEPDRTVGVVLVTANANREVSYYQEPNSASENASPIQETSVPSEQISAAALPPATSVPSINSAVSLPGPDSEALANVQAASEGLVGGTGNRPIIDPYGDVAAVMELEAKRVKKAGPVGPQASLSLFGAPAASGHSFMFLIDRSQSMGAEGLNALSAAEGELLAELAKLKPIHSFQIVAYNEAPKYLRERKLLPATPESLAAAREFMQTLGAYGPTDHSLALISALRLQPDVIFLFTDGDDPYVGMRQRERIRAVVGHTHIHCVQFGRNKPIDETSRECLQALARENGGSYTFVDMAARK